MWEGAPDWRDAERGMGKKGDFKGGKREGREIDFPLRQKKEGRSPQFFI